MGKARRIMESLITILFIIVFAILLSVHIKAIKTGEEPSLFGYKGFYVGSGSMSPEIPVGSLIVVEETDAENIVEKDIITYRNSKKTVVTHRVIEIDQKDQSFITQGDANEYHDLFPVKPEQIIGRVVLDIPYVGYLIDFLRSKYGIITLWAFGLVLLVLDISKKKQNAQER